jgi:hypothetical protein
MRVHIMLLLGGAALLAACTSQPAPYPTAYGSPYAEAYAPVVIIDGHYDWHRDHDWDHGHNWQGRASDQRSHARR